MIQNNIRTLRLKRRFTQRQLAELAGTSQQQVQRIEAGLQSPRIDLARQLASALHVSMRDMFPSVPTAELPADLAPLDNAAIALAKAGVDIDPCLYTFRVKMRGGLERDFEIASTVRKRLGSILNARSSHYFAVFDTASERIAINLKELSFCQFLFDVGADSTGPSSEEDDEPLKFWLVNSAESLTFDVDHDDVDDEEGEAGNVSDIFHYLDMYDGDDDDVFTGQVSFVDADGERAMLLSSHVAACSVPLEYVSSAYLRAQTEGEEEDFSGQVTAEG
jgi:transcriptional regulator with XRE-family HTH domain